MPLFLWPIIVLVLIFLFTVLFGAPYVPSRNAELDKAFKNLYPLSKKDFLIDLGSGDGKVLRAAHKFGAKSLGLELNPILVAISRWRLRRLKDAKVLCRDFFLYDFPAETTVVYVFGDGRDMARIVRHIEKQAECIGHPIFLISHAFKAEGYKAEKCYRAYYLYKIKEKK